MTCTSQEHTPLAWTSGGRCQCQRGVKREDGGCGPFWSLRLPKPLTGGLLHDVHLTGAHAMG
jgi:hypothetical protein